VSRNYGGTMVADLFARFGADTEEWQKEMRSAVTRMLFAAESLTQAGRIMSTAITAPMAAIAAVAVKTAVDFDRSMTKMKTLVGVAADVVDGWRDGIMSISSDTGRAATELADAMFFITSNGLRGAEAMQVLDASAKAAAIGLGEAKDVAFAATSAINAYGAGSMTGAEAVAVLVKTVREGNLEASELPQVLGQVLPVASELGVEFHEIGAAIAAMTRSGVSAKIAALGMRSVLQSILDPTIGAAKAALEMGTSFEKIRDIAEKDGVIYALQEIGRATEGNAQKLSQIFPNQKAFIAALQLMGNNAEAVEGVFKSLAATTEDDLNVAFEDTTKSVAFLADQAKADLTNALIKLGDNLHFMIRDAAESAKFLAKLAEGFDKLPPTIKGVITGIAALVFAIGPLLYGLGNLARMSARGMGLSILFQLPWIKKAAEIRAFGASTSTASLAVQKFGQAAGAWKALNIAGLIGTAAVAGWTLGKTFDDLFGITDKLNAKFGEFGNTTKEISSVYEKHGGLMQENAMSAAKLAEQIGETDLKERLLKASLEGNSLEVSRLVVEVNGLAAAYNKETIAAKLANQTLEKRKTGAEQVAEAMIKLQEEEAKATAEIKKQYDLMTSDEVMGALDELMVKREKARRDGISEAQINRAMAQEFLDYLKLAQEYNLEIDDGMKKWANTLKEEGVQGFEEVEKLLERTNQHIDAQPGKVIEGMVMVGDSVATHLTNGFGRGFEAGSSKLTSFQAELRGALMRGVTDGFGAGFEQFPAQLRASLKEIYNSPLKIPVVPDEDVWLQFFYDLAKGKYPIS